MSLCRGLGPEQGLSRTPGRKVSLSSFYTGRQRGPEWAAEPLVAPRPELWSLLHGDESKRAAETWGRTLLVEGPVKGEKSTGVGRGPRVPRAERRGRQPSSGGWGRRGGQTLGRAECWKMVTARLALGLFRSLRESGAEQLEGQSCVRFGSEVLCEPPG